MTSQSPLDLLPGYKGYKDLEQRRESDKQARLAVAAALTGFAGSISRIQNDALGAGGIGFMDALGTVKTALQTLADRISAAPRGYTGLFATNNIRAETLDQILAFDRELLTETGSIGPALEAVAKAMDAGAGQKEAIKAALTTVKAVSIVFDKRARLLGG